MGVRTDIRSTRLVHCIAAEEGSDLCHGETMGYSSSCSSSSNDHTEQGAPPESASDLSSEELHQSSIMEKVTNDLLGSSFAAVAKIRVPKIWQCRLLQTLDLRVKWNFQTSPFLLLVCISKPISPSKSRLFLDSTLPGYILVNERSLKQGGKGQEQETVPRFGDDQKNFTTFYRLWRNSGWREDGWMDSCKRV